MAAKRAAVAAFIALLGGLPVSAVSPATMPQPVRELAKSTVIPAEVSDPEPAHRTSTPVAPPATGEVVRDSFVSEAMGQRRMINVYLPPSYNLPQAEDRAYPALYLLHGDDAGIDAWPSLGIRELIQHAVRERGLPELMVVMPDGAGHYNDETDWANRWDGSDRIEDQLLDLVRYVDETYRTLATRPFRFIGGYSSGGFGALNIALHHPELFGAALSLSGFAGADDSAADPGVFGTDRVYLRSNSPAWLITSGAGRGLYFVLTAGERDRYFLARTRTFARQLEQLGIAHEFRVVAGGHDGRAWSEGLGIALDYLPRTLATREMLGGSSGRQHTRS